MGFGHRVYRAEDPRARVLRRTAKEIGVAAARGRRGARAGGAGRAQGPPARPRAGHQRRVLVGRRPRLPPRCPPDLFTSLFSCARVAGWSAHILEQKREGRLIRPTAKYIGPAPRPVSEVESLESTRDSAPTKAGAVSRSGEAAPARPGCRDRAAREEGADGRGSEGRSRPGAGGGGVARPTLERSAPVPPTPERRGPGANAGPSMRQGFALRSPQAATCGRRHLHHARPCRACRPCRRRRPSQASRQRWPRW